LPPAIQAQLVIPAESGIPFAVVRRTVVVEASVVVAGVVATLPVVPVPAFLPELQPASDNTQIAPTAAAAIFKDFINTPRNFEFKVIMRGFAVKIKGNFWEFAH
jgi:hypothetical protein